MAEIKLLQTGQLSQPSWNLTFIRWNGRVRAGGYSRGDNVRVLSAGIMPEIHLPTRTDSFLHSPSRLFLLSCRCIRDLRLASSTGIIPAMNSGDRCACATNTIVLRNSSPTRISAGHIPSELGNACDFEARGLCSDKSNAVRAEGLQG